MHARGNGRDGRWALWRIPDTAANSTIPVVDLTAVACFHYFNSLRENIFSISQKLRTKHGMDLSKETVRRLQIANAARITPSLVKRRSSIVICRRP
jgi:hypothetical protein